jgi:hypothetical protein
MFAEKRAIADVGKSVISSSPDCIIEENPDPPDMGHQFAVAVVIDHGTVNRPLEEPFLELV